MTDDELDRRLREAVSVAASGDLTARVRARLSAEPGRSPLWRWRPAVAGGALALVGVLAAVISIARPPLVDAPRVDPTPGRVEAGPEVIEQANVDRPEVGRSMAPARTTRRAVVVAPDAQAPPPRFAAGDAEAFRVLLAFSRAALATAGVEPSEVSMPDAPLVLQPLDIQPVAIAPLVLVDTTIEGGPQ